jgi:hypothetical protein
MVDGPQVRSGHVDEKENILPLLRIEPRSFSLSSLTILFDLVNICFDVTKKFKLSELLPISGPYLTNGDAGFPDRHVMWHEMCKMWDESNADTKSIYHANISVFVYKRNFR